MDVRLFAAIFTGKLIAKIIKLTGGGATAAPGLYALKIDPNIVKKLSSQIPQTIVVSGTNGKTTTSRLIYNILSQNSHVLHNRQGSNLLRGIASTLILKSSISGKINVEIGLWETDEATLPNVIENTTPQTVVLLNLFRDQLDRYGEVDSIRKKWQEALKNLNKTSTLILNADDPGVSFLAENFEGNVFYFGVEKASNLPPASLVSDVKHCLKCSSSLKYSVKLSSHLGHYICPNCNFKRPKAQIAATEAKLNKNFSTSLSLKIKNASLNINYNLPGLYNVYNILAATAAASHLKTSDKKIKMIIEDFSSAFGRFQKIKINDKNVIFFLIKNPTGANEVLRTISIKSKLNILAVLNDNYADGKDVSWIWDTNWEQISKSVQKITVCGTRAWEMANRLKYAQIPLGKKDVYEDINCAIDESLKSLNKNDTLIILPSYTALLKIQKELAKKGKLKAWHSQ